MNTYSNPNASIEQSFNDLSMNISAIFSIMTNFCQTFDIPTLKRQYSENMQNFQYNANYELYYRVINQMSTFHDTFNSIQNQNIIQNCLDNISHKISEQQNLNHENESIKSQSEYLHLNLSEQNSAQNTKRIDSLKSEITSLKVQVDQYKRENKHLRDQNSIILGNAGKYWSKDKHEIQAESDGFRKLSNDMFIENSKLVTQNNEFKYQIQKLTAENQQLKKQIENSGYNCHSSFQQHSYCEKACPSSSSYTQDVFS